MSADRRWLRTAILVGAVYFVVGIAFAALANSSAANHVRAAWRLAAWLISAAVFAAHIGYEHFRLRRSPRTTAWHAAVAVAVGAFFLAAAANAHGLSAGTGHRRALAIALVAWPALTAVPAFVVALAAAAVLKRTQRTDGRNHEH